MDTQTSTPQASSLEPQQPSSPFPPAVMYPGSTKFCTVCERDLPLYEYGFNTQTGRPMAACNRCRAAQRRSARAMKERLRKTLATKLERLMLANSNLPHTSEMAVELLRRFAPGREGLTAFSISYYNQLQEAIQRDPGSNKVLKAHEAIAKLIAQANEQIGAARPVDDLTDQELMAELHGALGQTLSIEAIEDDFDEQVALIEQEQDGGE